MKKRKMILLAIDLLAMVFLIWFDQFTKNTAVLYLKGKPDIPLLKDVLVLQYLENRGAAFGMLQNQKLFFLFTEIVILLVIGFVMLRLPADKNHIISAFAAANPEICMGRFSRAVNNAAHYSQCQRLSDMSQSFFQFFNCFLNIISSTGAGRARDYPYAPMSQIKSF